MASYCSRARFFACANLLPGAVLACKGRKPEGLAHAWQTPAPVKRGQESLRTMMPPCLCSAHGGVAFFLRRVARNFAVPGIRYWR